MNKNQAEAWVKELTDLLSGRELITVAVTPIGSKVTVRQNQKFNRAYFVEYDSGACSVAISDSYGVMTGAKEWQIDPNARTVLCHLTNGYGEPLHYTWTIAGEDDDGKVWRQLKDAQERLWRVR